MSTSPTFTSASSFNLNSDTFTGSFYNATLTGSSRYAKAHTLNPASPSGITGDTIVTTATKDTIYGGTNYDFLVAGGSQNLVTTQTISGGHDTLVSANNNNTLIGNSAATFELTNSAYLSNNSLKGTGSNGLLITSGATINDNFSSLSGIGALSLSGVSSVSLGAAAQTDGLKAVYAGNGNTYLRQLGNDNLAATLVGGTGNDSFDIYSKSQFVADSIVGGAGVDQVKILSAATLTDANFSKVQSEEVLQLWRGSQAALGAVAGAAGFSTISAINGAITLNASEENARGLTYNLSTNAAGGDSIVGTSLGDNFYVNGGYFALETLNGGLGNDTLSIRNAVTLSDSFANKSSIEVLSLSGASAVSLGAAAQTTGIKTVIAGSGNTYVRQLGNDNLATTLVGGTGNDSFDIYSKSQFVADSIVGGSGVDQVKILSAATLTDANFSRVQSEEVLQLWGGSQAMLGAAAGAAGFSTISAINGAITLNAAGENARGLTYNLSLNSAGGDSIVGTSLGDSFIVNGKNFTLETLNGGAGKDTLSIRNAVTLNDSFQNDTGIEALSVTSPSQITLGGNAAIAGINSLYGGAGSDSFTQLASDTLATTFIGGAGNDFFSIASSSSLAVDSIAGGAGIADTLSIATPATINDSFTRVSGVEALSLTGSSKVTLGGNAQGAGIASVFGGNSSTTIDASGYTTGVTLNASANTLTGDLLIGSQTAPNDFIVNGNSNFSLNKVYGGDGIDTLSTATSLTTNDQFRNVHDVEVLSLGAASNVQLGSNAAAAGISEVIGSAGNDTLVQTSSNTEDLTLAGGAGNDSISVFSTDALANDSISGGSGVNTLRIATSAYLADNAFTNVSGIQALQLTSQSAVTLGNNAENAGIASVFGGAGSDTFTQLNTAPTVTLVGGGDSDLFKVQTGGLLSGDSIIGGLGSDTLAITSSDQTISNFNGVTGIEALSLSGGNNVVNLTGGEGGSQFSTVIGGSGNDSFAVGNLGTIDIIGGAGIDTVSTATSYTISDSLLGSLKSVEVLQTGSSYTKVTLGSAAQAAGISSLIGGTGSGYTTVEQSFANNLYYNGTASSNYQGIGFANQQQFANATLVGNGWSNSYYGSGMNIASASTLSDYAFRNKRGLSDLYLNESEFAAHSEVTFSSYASAAGVKNVYGKNGSITFNQSTLDADGIKIDDSYYTNRGGNLYNLQDFSLLEGHTINPGVVSPAIPPTVVGRDTIYGAGLTDTLAVGGFSASSKYQPEFQNVHNVGVLSLTGGGTESSKYNQTIGGGVLLDNSAEEAGIQTVYGSQDNSYIIQTHYPTDSLNPSGWTNGLDIYGGRGNDVIGLFGFAGTLGNCTDDTYNTTAGMLANDVIDGGRGVNTLGLFTYSNDTVPPAVVTPANYRPYLPINYGDSSFTHVKNIQALAIYDTSSYGGSSVTLGGNAFNAGIESVFGGDYDTIYADWNEVGRNLTLDVSAYDGNGHDLLIGQQERGALGFENIFINLGLGNINGLNTIQGAFQPQPTSNEFIFGRGYAVGTSTVIGGLGNRDSLYLNSNSSYHATLTDSQFSSVGLINNLVLNGNSSATLGAYASNAFGSYGTGSSKYGSLSGIHTVWGGVNYDTLSGNTLGDTIIQASTWSSYHGLTVVGGHGNDYIGVENSSLLAQDSIYGGFSLESANCVVTNHGMDTLEIGGGVTLNDSWGKGANINEIEALVLSCSTGGEGVGSAITLGSTFQSYGLDSIYGSDCNDTITILSSNTASNYINALAGNDLVTVDYGAAVGKLGGFNNNTLNGGDGIDTLVVGVPATLSDSDFSNVSHFEGLQLTATGGEGAGSAVTLGATADLAGFVSVFGSVANDTITVTSDDTLVSYINAGNGNDLVSVDSLGQFSTIDGGIGTDTLVLSNTLSNNDSFSNVFNFEALQLSGSGSYASSVTLGGSAQGAGFVSVYGSAGDDTITVTSGDTLLSYIYAGDGNDLVSVASLGQFSTIDGGIGGTDTLALSNTLSNNDSFGNVYNFNALQLTGTGGEGNSVTLGSSADAAGFVSVYGSTGDDTITVTSGDTLLSYINAGDGNDLVSVDSLGQFSTIDGGFGGTDTLVLGSTLSNNDSFGNVINFNALQLSGSGSYGTAVTLGASADAAGFTSLYGSAGNDTITVTFSDTLLSYLNAGDGNDLVSVDSLGQFSTIDGGAGIDTINLGGVTLNDGNFGGTTVQNFEVISVGCNTSSSFAISHDIGSAVTLGANMAASGLTSLIGSDCNDTLTIAAGDTLATYLNANAGNDFVTVDFGGASTVSGGGSVTPTHETLTASAAYAIAQSNVLTSFDGVSFSGVYLSSNYIASDSPGSGLSLGGSFGSPLTLESATFHTTAAGGDITYTLQGYDSLGSPILGDTLSFTGAEGTSTLVNFRTLFSGVYEVGISNGNAGNTFGLDSLVVDTLPAQGAVTLTGNNFTVHNGGINSGSSYGRLNLTGSSLIKKRVSGWYNHYANTSETIHSAFGGNFTLSSVDYKTNTLGGSSDWSLQGYDSLGNPITGETATLTGSSTYALDTLGGAWTLGSRYVVLSNISSISGSYLYIDSLGYTLPTLGGGSSTLPAFNGSTLDGSLGTDTLHVGVGATLRDNDFINVHSFEALLLSGTNSSTNEVTLGSTAQTTGFSSVFAGTSASAYVDASAYTNDIYITGTGSSYGLTLVGGSGNDTIIGGYAIADSLVGNGGDNLFQFSNATNLGNSTIVGAAGTDTLELTTTGDINDAFSHDTLLNALAVAGGSNATLAANAQSAGFTSVFITDTLGASIYQEAGDTLHINFQGNKGDDLFYFANSTLLGNDTVTGNGGTDTITVGSSATLSDAQFTNVSGIDALSLTGGPNVVYFNPGADAQSAGISSIYGGSGSNFLTVNYTGSTDIYLQSQNSSDTLVAGGGNDTLQAWSGTATTNSANDTYTGGAGSDYYVLGDTLGNAYGQSGSSPKASITDFNQKEDYLNVYNYGAGAADYTTQTLTGAYNLEILHGGNVVSQMYVQNLDRANFLTGGHVNYLS
jgi:serralysin